MLTNPLPSTILIVLSGFLLSVLGMFVADPYCRDMQASKLSSLGQQTANRVIRELESQVATVTEAGKRFRRLEELNESQFNETLDELLQLDGVFAVELARREANDDDESAMQKVAVGSAPPVMSTGSFPSTFRVIAADSRKSDLAESIGTERLYTLVREVYQNDGTLITKPHQFYAGLERRRGIATTMGPREETPIGMLTVTFDELISPALLESDEVDLQVRVIKLSPEALRARSPDYQVNRSDAQLFQAQKKIGGQLFRFTVSEAPGARFHPQWIKWAVFLASNAIACIVGLTWLQRGRAELLNRNQELEREVERRTALQKHLQATIDFRDHERELIAHEIHDGFVQDIVGAQMYAESALAQTESDSSVRSHAVAIADLLRNAIQEARKTIDYLKPRVVDECGLVAALSDSVDHDLKNYSFVTKLVCDEELPRFPILVERMLYRVVREAVNNARQHSGTNEAMVSLRVDEELIVAEVIDEGAGFDESLVDAASFGLPGIRQRIEMLNGTVELKTSEFGTKLTVEIPRDMKTPEMPANQSLMLEV